MACFAYDAMGNMISRTITETVTTTYIQEFDVENRLVTVTVQSEVTAFAYDADGQRVKTVEPDGTAVYTPFPSYEEEVVPGGATIARSFYLLNGAAVAFRITGAPPTPEDGLYFIHSDHLGSTSLLTDQNGNPVGDIVRYYPYGEYRSAPTVALVDRGYTGHRENRSLGLIYMNARYYVVYINRFISADSIVPNFANPQSLNRYSYVENRPTVFSDPTGHCIVGYSGDVTMDQYPYGTSGICPNTSHWIVEGNAAIGEYHDSLAEPPNYPIYETAGPTHADGPSCTLTLNECFYYRDRQGTRFTYLKDFEGHDEANPIPLAEFEQLLTGVAAELYLHDVDSPGFKGQRNAYDTPFYNGGGRGTDDVPIWPSDQRVCIETMGCFGRSEINYFAQGMWSAAAGESLTTARAIVWGWKATSYGESPSDGDLFWLEYGYLYYKAKADYWHGLQ